jgi:formylmethanofuran--tetrahydromethanopterin N-formyltransferase
MRAAIEDTYAEVFEGLYARVIVTADDKDILQAAAQDSTSTPSIVIGRVEGGVETYVNAKDTPDGRAGAILQFWGGLDDKKPIGHSLNKFETELAYRIRQDILVKPFTAVFDASKAASGKLDMMEKIGHCGDGFEREIMLYGRRMISIPIMVPDFMIESTLGYAKGIMGANFWYMCETKNAVIAGGKDAIKAIREVEGVIVPFGICAAGSKPETQYPSIGPTTNHPYCPSLKKTLGHSSKVPPEVNFIPEIVINGVSLKAVSRAMQVGIEAARATEGVRLISAGNYGGNLGKHRIYLKELFT